MSTREQELKNRIFAKVDSLDTPDVWTIFHRATEVDDYNIQCACRAVLRSRGISTR